MPHPKRKHSKTRRDKRRTHYKSRGSHGSDLPRNRTASFIPQSPLVRRKTILQRQGSNGKSRSSITYLYRFFCI